MTYNFSKLKTKTEDIKIWFKGEISTLRTGRATPAFVENIIVESYGAKTPLKHIASITTENAQTLLITPWDAGLLKDIETAISSSNLGVQPIAVEKSVRISLPSLTEERRDSLIKLIGEKMEKAKISLRAERDDTWKNIQEEEKEGLMSEDDKFRAKDEMQKIIDDTTKEFKEIADKKEVEIRS